MVALPCFEVPIEPTHGILSELETLTATALGLRSAFYLQFGVQRVYETTIFCTPKRHDVFHVQKKSTSTNGSLGLGFRSKDEPKSTMRTISSKKPLDYLSCGVFLNNPKGLPIGTFLGKRRQLSQRTNIHLIISPWNLLSAP